MATPAIKELYRPNHDEASRQEFVGVFKGLANGKLEAILGDKFTSDYVKAYAREHGKEPQTRQEAVEAMRAQHLYQLWGSLVYTSQDLMWETCGETVDRQREAFEERAAAVLGRENKLGSLTLDPKLARPHPIASREVHRQPGGYFYEADDADLTTALLYLSSIELYRTAKGLSSGADTGEPGMGRFMMHHLKQRFPALKPKRVLDLGCAIGTETLALHEAFPDAEVHGLDLSGPMLRFAHMWAEEQGTPVHYREANAADTGYPDDHFDVVMSHILFHETGPKILPAIMPEVERILAPGGVFINGDVPYQPAQIPLHRQALNSWQVQHNGEFFWNGFADTDVSSAMATAGFASDNIFADYVPLGMGQYYVFGARKASA
ncbi:MAG: class I SAM-dependent methyltransferase [Pseudomonadota bacterium]